MRHVFSKRRVHNLVPALALAFGSAILGLEPSAAAQPKAAPPTGAAPSTPKPEDRRQADKAAAKVEEKKGEENKSADRKPDPAAAVAQPAKDDDENERAIYLSADIGFTRPNIGGFSDNTGLDKTAANGLLAGLGIGYRMKDLRIGARFRDASTTEFSLWSLMAEVGYALKMRPVTPIFFVHAGYMFDSGIERSAFASQLPKGNILTPNVDVDGFVVGVEAGASYWVTKFLRVGPFLGLDATFLSRAKPGLPQSIVPLTDETRHNALFGDSGSGVGYVLSLGVRVTGDVGF